MYLTGIILPWHNGKSLLREHDALLLDAIVCIGNCTKKGLAVSGIGTKSYPRLPCAGSIPVGWPRIVRSFITV